MRTILVLVMACAALVTASVAVAAPPDHVVLPPPAQGPDHVELFEQAIDASGNPTGPPVQVTPAQAAASPNPPGLARVASTSGCKNIWARYVNNHWSGLYTLWIYEHTANFCWQWPRITSLWGRNAYARVYDGAWKWTGNINPSQSWFAWCCARTDSGYWARREGVLVYGAQFAIERKYPDVRLEHHADGSWRSTVTCCG